MEQLRHGSGDVATLYGAQFVSAELLRVGLGAEHGDGRTDRCRLLAMCRQGDILGLASRLGDDEFAKDLVDPRDDRLGGAEVDGEGGAIRDVLSGGEEGADVGPSEPVDRLLRIADKEEAPRTGLDLVPRLAGDVDGGIGRDQDCEFDLDRVGVLELVEQQAGIPRAKRVPDRNAVLRTPQQAARPDEQIVKLEPTDLAPLLGGVEHEPTQPSGHVGERRRGDLGDGIVAGGDQIGEGCPHVGDVDGPLVLIALVADSYRPRRLASAAHVGSDRQRVDVVEGAGEIGAVVAEIREPSEQRIVVGCVLPQFENVVDAGQETRTIEGRRRRCIEVESLLHKIPVVGHLHGEAAQVIESNTARLEA